VTNGRGLSLGGLFLIICTVIIGMGWLAVPMSEKAYAQHPTLSIPTVTGTPSGPVARVYQNYIQIPVRTGPGSVYPEIGLLTAGQSVPALGTSPGRDYVQVAYPGVKGGTGWVFANFVEVSGSLDVVVPPPTPTPRVTPTLNPTLAAQAVVENVQPTKLPTFTPAPPVSIPTFEPSDDSLLARRSIPMGFVMVGFAIVGMFGIILSLLRGR
jgi:hypothetical protein